MATIRVVESVEIDRPVEEVFPYVANPQNIPMWAGVVVEVRKEGDDRFTLVQKFLGRRFETPCEVISSEPNRRFAFRSTGGPFPLDFTYTCEPSAKGTRFTHAGEGEPGTFFKLAGPVFEKVAKRQVRNDLETLKDLLESET